MTRITAADQILLLLRERLQRTARSQKNPPPGRAGPLSAAARMEALAATRSLSDEDFKRALVRSLLAERMGEALVNDPAFEAVTAEVFRILSDAPEGTAVLTEAAAQFRGD